jgi:site-specific DNA recombinase
MSKNVIIYTRVSTDEQANHGFSLPHQEQVILAYCKVKNYTVLQVVKEDYSAKTFDRPEWNKILALIKSKRNAVDAIVFLRWDRFSRNSEESLRMIRVLLKNYGVEVETVEQQIDLTVPENKLLLAIYLTTPEIENQKNSIRTTEGSRKARLEGCWTGTAPFGYSNARNEHGKSTLVPDKDAEHVKEAFDLMAMGIYSAEEVRKRLRKKGVKLTKQGFLNLLRNVAYLGNVLVKAHAKESAQIVPGLHPPIVKNETFAKVQNVLRAKRPNFKFGINRSQEYPLRQFIVCPVCRRGLTASGSTSRNGTKHHYYHCTNKACDIRYRLNDVHDDFNEYLQGVKVDKSILELYSAILEDVFQRDGQEGLREIEQLKAQEELIGARMKKVQDSYCDGITTPAEYRSAMDRYSNEAAEYQVRINAKREEITPYKKYIAYGFSLISHLPEYYNRATLEVQHKILGSMFPKKLHYVNNSFRTTPKNSVLSLLLQEFNGLEGPKNKMVGENADQSSEARRR